MLDESKAKLSLDASVINAMTMSLDSTTFDIHIPTQKNKTYNVNGLLQKLIQSKLKCNSTPLHYKRYSITSPVSTNENRY